MKTTTSRRCSGAILGLVLLGALPASAGTLGWVEHNGVRMPVEDAVAVWHDGWSRLRVYLFPYEVRAEEAELCREDMPHAIDRPSVDEGKWPHWNPFGQLSLSWMFSPEARGELDEANFEVFGWGIPAENRGTTAGMSLSNPHPDVEVTLEGEAASGREVTVRSRGREEVQEGDVLSWDLDLTVEVLAAVE